MSLRRSTDGTPIVLLLAASAMIGVALVFIGSTVASRAAASATTQEPAEDVSGHWLESGSSVQTSVDSRGRSRLATKIGFVPNQGQHERLCFDQQCRDVLFTATVDGASVLVLEDRVLTLPRSSTSRPETIRLDHGARVTAEQSTILPGVLHFLHGNDRSRWATHVPHYGALRIVADGGSSRYNLRIEGGQLASSDTRARSSMLRSLSLVVEPAAQLNQGGVPTLAYSTYLGGGRNEIARGIAVDRSGHAYVAGATNSSNLPSKDPLQPQLGNSGVLQDAFVAKLSPDGTTLVFATYLGGVRQDEAMDVAVDDSGRVHLTGYTMSPDFPMEKPIQDRVQLSDGIFSGDAFVSRLSPDGSSLEFSTPLGGTARDIGKGVAVDDAGHTYITGWTGSNFPAVNAIYRMNRGVTDAFVAKIAPSGDKLVYSTHLGGQLSDRARDIAVDSEGSAHIVGVTESSNFRVHDPFQRSNAGGRDAFVAKFAPEGQEVTWATYLGGRTDDYGTGIAVGGDGAVTVVGRTDSPNFPRHEPLQRLRSGTTDLFISRFNADGDNLLYSTYLGGSRDEADCAEVVSPRRRQTPTPAPSVPRLPAGSRFPDGPVADIAVDAAGRAYVSTCTGSTNAAVVKPVQSTRRGAFSTYVAVLDPSGTSLEFATYIAGQGLDIPRGAVPGPDGSIFVAGQTTSSDFPLVPTVPLQDSRAGTDDAFVLKIASVFAPSSPTPVPPTATQEPTPTAAATDTPTVTITPLPSATSTVYPSPSPTIGASETPDTTEGGIWLPYSHTGSRP